jgi:hypothetical protein
VIILGFLLNLYIQGESSANNPASLGGLAVFLALVGYYLVGIPAMLICTLLWLAYRASKAARARARQAGQLSNSAPQLRMDLRLAGRTRTHPSSAPFRQPLP